LKFMSGLSAHLVAVFFVMIVQTVAIIENSGENNRGQLEESMHVSKIANVVPLVIFQKNHYSEKYKEADAIRIENVVLGLIAVTIGSSLVFWFMSNKIVCSEIQKVKEISCKEESVIENVKRSKRFWLISSIVSVPMAIFYPPPSGVSGYQELLNTMIVDQWASVHCAVFWFFGYMSAVSLVTYARLNHFFVSGGGNLQCLKK